jgi:hypothetical protein
MIIYKVVNKINGKWYIGKDAGNNAYYLGSGKILKNAINKYGKENFEKIVLEYCNNKTHLAEREKHWIAESNATTDPMSYNLASGGEGGDLSKFINYATRDTSNNTMQGIRTWWKLLSPEEKTNLYANQAEKRTKGWYVSTVINPTEVYVQNISKWCEEHNVDKSMPTALNNPKSHLFQKQTKGWRIRRADMPKLSPYENLRGKVIVDNGCKGRGWKLVDNKRVWYDK